jgi:hypothetical protein
MAEAASISYGNEFSSEPRKSPLSKHIPDSSKVRKTPHGLHILVIRMSDSLKYALPLVSLTHFPFSSLAS